MKRKIVQHGSSSLTVTLPVDWVDKYKIKKGDEVNVEEAGPTLSITTFQEIASPKKVISTAQEGIFTKNNLSHLYQLGYNEIEVKFDNPKILDEIKERISNCIGFEIIDQKDHTLYIKSIANTLETEFDTLLRKSFMITNEMAKSLLEALEKGEYSKLMEIRNLESLNNKFTDVCLRLLNKKGYKVPQRTMQMYEIVKNIERIADEFKYLCDLFSGHKEKLKKELLLNLKQAVDYYLDFYNLFYKGDPELKKKVYLDRKPLMEKYLAQMQKEKGINILLLHHCIKIVEKTYDGVGGYFALVL
ncbi:MAG: AbrB/MazE/SpoVT family DNA-binding domain-containing protein [Candidatus Woesearchaeota archaeon]|jgi:phosphate uptake regulator